MQSRITSLRYDVVILIRKDKINSAQLSDIGACKLCKGRFLVLFRWYKYLIKCTQGF